MKNKFLKNKIVLVAVMILLGSFSIALAAPGDAPSRPPVHPGNSSQPIDYLRIGGSSLSSAGLDVGSSNSFSYFDKADSFITVAGSLWIGGTTWLGPVSSFLVSDGNLYTPGFIPLPIRALNIVGTFLSSTLSHDGTIAAQRPVCVQNSKLILCNAPAVTYQWDISAWGPCSGGTGGSCSGGATSGVSSCVRNTLPSTACENEAQFNTVPELGAQACAGETSQSACGDVGFEGFYTHIGQCYRCMWETPTASCSSYTTQTNCQANSCTWSATGGTQTRDVVCKDSNGTTVADSFCVAPKPATSQSCTQDEVGDGSGLEIGVGSGGPFASCFIANTQIELANGRFKNIQDVKIGDVLKGESSMNTVQGFHQPKLGQKKLYSFNDGPYFVTAEHPFMTTEGWKALDPELAVKEHRLNIVVTQLAIGDVLVTDNGLEKLVSLDSKSDSPDTQLYNFILDGDNTYYADGYLVHNKAACYDQEDCPGKTCFHSSTGYPDATNGNFTGSICSLGCSTPGAILGGSCVGYGPYTQRYCGDDYQIHCRIPQ